MAHPFDTSENSKSLEKINMRKANDLHRTMTFIDQKYKFSNLNSSGFDTNENKQSFTNKNG